MNKIIRDGKVAVLYSPGFGAGWSTWHHSDRDKIEMLCMDARIVQPVLDGNNSEAARIANELMGDDYFYDGGAKSLTVAWVPQGARFEITEYDGAESVKIIEFENYMEA